MQKILVAEDDQFLAKAYSLKLGREGFEVKVVGDGDGTIAALDSFQPKLLILDLLMPGKDGFTALTEIRKNPKWKDLIVIVASNLNQKEDIDRAKSLGATDFIVKSDLSMNELLAKIKAYLKE